MKLPDVPQCANNLRQINLAAQNHAAALRTLPPLATANWNLPVSFAPFNKVAGATVFLWLLPYLEEQVLFDVARQSGQIVLIDFSQNPVGVSGAAATSVAEYLCPSDPGVAGLGDSTSLFGGANTWAAGCYGANYLVLGAPGTGSAAASDWTIRIQGTGKTTFARSFPDGTSQTVLFAERYSTCGNSGALDTANASLWGDSDSYFRPVFCVNQVTQEPYTLGYYGCLGFQVAPHPLNSCDSSRAIGPRGWHEHCAGGRQRAERKRRR